MARIAYPDAATMEPEIAERLRKLGSLNVTRMMAHNPGIMEAYGRMGVQILRKGVLDPVLREVIILRIGILCDSDYEKHQHISVARAVGMDEATLAAVLADDRAALDERTQVALMATDEIFANHGASEATMARAAALFSPAELVELALVPGFYVMTAGHLKSFDIEVEDTPPLGDRMATKG